MSKVSIIGAGFVGSSIAYALVTSGLISEVLLIDKNEKKAEGEALDIGQGSRLTRPVDIYSGGIEDCKDSLIIIFTAGAAQRAGVTRLDLALENTKIVRDILPELIRVEPKAILIMVTNPVDVLTFVAQKLSGLPPEKVIGSGTVLDTARFRYSLSHHLGIDLAPHF